MGYFGSGANISFRDEPPPEGPNDGWFYVGESGRRGADGAAVAGSRKDARARTQRYLRCHRQGRNPRLEVRPAHCDSQTSAGKNAEWRCLEAAGMTGNRKPAPVG